MERLARDPGTLEADQGVAGWVLPAARALVHAMNDELSAHGVTHPQWQVLRHLVTDPDVSQVRLAERMCVEPPTLCGILDRMERDGWISRHPHESDRRRNRIDLEERVAPVWRQMLACAERVRRRATRGLDDGELETLRGLLERIRANLEEE